MSADVLLRVARALKTLLETDAAVGADRVAIGPPPAATARLDGPRLGLFLYRVEPSAALRDRPRLVRPTTPGEQATTRAGLALDLRFLLSAFGPEDETGLGAEQLVLLGGALRSLASTSFLAGEGLADQAPRLSIDPLSSEEMARIWGLFPDTAFQTSVGLLVAPVWIDVLAVPTAPPVKEGRLLLGERQR